jgi:threonine/homoserine/homoserine lactone efflux protein
LRSSNIAAPGYLIYLGITGCRAGGIVGLAGQVMRSRPLSLAKVYRQGVLTDLLNPKLLLFFFSFLPQFVDSARGSPSLQMLVLGLLFQVTGVPTNLMVALAGGSVAGLLARNPFWARLQRWLSEHDLGRPGHPARVQRTPMTTARSEERPAALGDDPC